RHLGRLKDAQPAAGAGTDEDDAAVLAQRRRDHFHPDGDALAFAPHSVEHLAIFVEHQVNKVVSVELVDSETECVDSFGGEGLPLGTNRHTTTILVNRLI